MKDNPKGIGWVGGTSCRCKELGYDCAGWEVDEKGFDVGTDEDGLLEAEEEFLSGRDDHKTQISVEVSIPEVRPYDGYYQKNLIVTGTRGNGDSDGCVVLFLDGASIRVKADYLVNAIEAVTGDVHGF